MNSPTVTDASASALTLPTGLRDDPALKEALKRCSRATYEAALRFRQLGDVEAVPVLVHGIITRYVDPEQRPRMQNASDDLRLAEDLGIDSLTMMEIVLLTEEVLILTINADELRALRTLGDVDCFLVRKLRGAQPAGAGRVA